MPRGRAFAIELTQEERDVLERNIRRRKTSSALASRSRMVLLAAEGLTNLEIAARVGACGPTVGVWRNRFHEKRLEGLFDEPRVGRPREIGDDAIRAGRRRDAGSEAKRGHVSSVT